MVTNNATAATIGFEDQLWRAADALCSNMDAAEYKHIVFGLIYHSLHHRRTPCNSPT